MSKREQLVAVAEPLWIANKDDGHMSESRVIAEHAPCGYRRRETRDGITMDWCYAIGAEELGDMPCNYCADRRKDFRDKEVADEEA